VYKSHQYALNAFRQVQTFVDQNAAKLGNVNESEGRKLLDGVVSRIEAFGLEQSSAVLEMDGHSSRRKSLEFDLQFEHMKPIADYARAKLRGVPDYASLTRRTALLKGHALVSAARAMASAAQPYADALTRNAFPADALRQLVEAADKLEASIERRVNLKVRRVGATEGINEEAKRGKEAVKMLGAVIERQFAKDKTFLASWRVAKRVAVKPGVPRGSGVVSAGEMSEVAASA
jgi:hypothetical protein